MTNPFPYTLDNKRYHTQNYELRKTFGGKVCKISLDGGFTCPNLDGTKGVGGCTYCSGRGSGDFAQSALLPIEEQWRIQQEKMYQKWPGSGCIAYFQAHTNTYAPLPRLKELYEATLAQPNCVGLDIATRADCLSEEVCDYLEQLNRRCWLLVELGLQSTFDDTGERIHRCHSYADFLEGYRRLQRRGIRVCIHLINGLPGEDHQRIAAGGVQRAHAGDIPPVGFLLHRVDADDPLLQRLRMPEALEVLDHLKHRGAAALYHIDSFHHLRPDRADVIAVEAENDILELIHYLIKALAHQDYILTLYRRDERLYQHVHKIVLLHVRGMLSDMNLLNSLRQDLRIIVIDAFAEYPHGLYRISCTIDERVEII